MRKLVERASRLVVAAVAVAVLAASPVSFGAQPEPHVTAQDALRALAKRVKGGEQDKAFDITSAMRDYCVAGVGTQNGAYSVNDLEKMVGQQEAGLLGNLPASRDRPS